MAGGLRQVPAGELLAHDHGERFGDRYFLGHGAVVVALAPAALLEGGIEVGCDAGEPIRPQRLDPRLLDRVEDCARRLAARLLAHVGALVVVAEPQRQRIGRAPHQLHIERVEIARRERKLDLVARNLGLVRAEGDLKLLASPSPAMARSAEPTARWKVSTGVSSWATGRAPAQALACSGADDSGSSMPKHRWKYSAMIGRSISSHLFTKVVRKA